MCREREDGMTPKSSAEHHGGTPDIDGIDGGTAAAFSVCRVSDGTFVFSAWSDWTQAHAEHRPEVLGRARTLEDAIGSATLAARSMNPTCTVRIGGHILRSVLRRVAELDARSKRLCA